MKDAGLGDMIRAIASGSPVDWDAIDRDVDDPSVISLVDELKVIARIADVHGTRSLESPLDCAPDDDLQTWGPLTILGRIGAGSYGVVYRAWESRLDREVALKLLRPGQLETRADGPAIDEGRLLARVRHPNVVTVYGADRIDGRAGIWMELVEGRTIDEIVRTDGPVDALDAARIALEVVRGVAAIHQAGLVHRDIKAQNVVRQIDGRIVLMDLGAGSEIEVHDGASAAGTPIYLAPEVLAGSAATPASDVYSIGVLLYYLVSGSYPVVAPDLASVRQAHANGRSMPLDAVRVDVPRSFLNIVRQATAPVDEARFQSTADLERALSSFIASTDPSLAVTRKYRMLAVGTAVILALTLGGAAVVGWQHHVHPPVGFHARDWVLISGFENKTGEPVLDGTLEYAFERELSSSDFARVVSRDRVDDALRLMRGRSGTRIDLATAREISLRDGGIRVVLTGRIERIGGKYVLSTEIVNPSTGVAAAGFGDAVDTADALLQAVRRQTAAIRKALGEQRQSIDASVQALENVTTPSLAALQAYSTASATLAKTRTASPTDTAALAASAERDLRNAVQLDPSFASAHILLAWAIYAWQIVHPGDPGEYLREADQAQQLASSATDAERYFIIGSVHDLRAQAAERGWPYAPIGSASGEVKTELAAAVDAYESFLRLRPGDSRVIKNASLAYQRLGRYAELALMLGRVAAARPASFDAHVAAANASLTVGDLVSARSLLDRAGALAGELARTEPHTAAQVQVHVLRAKEAWLRRDAQTAARELDSAESAGAQQFEGVPALDWRVAAAQIAFANAALGRRTRAERVAAAIPDPDARTATLAQIFDAAGDLAALRQILREGSSHRNPLGRGGSLLVDAGMIPEARRLADDLEQIRTIVPSYVLFIRHAIAFHERRFADAIALGEQSQRLQLTPYNNQTLTIATNLADAYVAFGRPERAIAVLELETAHPAQAIGSSWMAGTPWMAARNKLSAMYRLVGRLADAAAIDDELERLVRAADHDYPLLVEVNSRIAARR